MIVLNYENTSGPDVFFNDLTIEYKESNLIQTTACYPYGMTAYTWMRDAEILNRYGFQGKEWESKTQWYDFHARQYDPVLGRWFALDPANQFASGYMGMGNNPIMGIDPDGRFFGWDDAIVAGVGFLYGYISTGISTGDWGEKALINGGINAVMFEVGYLTAGGGLAATAAAGAGGAGSMASAGGFLVSSAFNIAAAPYLPNIPIVQSKNFNLSISPTIALSGVGASANASYTSDNGWTVGAGVGVGSGGVNYGGGLSYYDRATGHGGGYSWYHFGGQEKQGLGEISYRHKDWTFRMSNDLFAGTGDKFRTAGFQMEYQDYSIGLLLHTGDPVDSKGNRPTVEGGGKAGTYSSPGAKDPKLRMGALYVGNKNYRVGWNSDGIRHVTQNVIMHNNVLKYIPPDFEYSPWFNTYKRPAKTAAGGVSVPSVPYIGINQRNPYSIWGW